jgi:hypothetical protein
MGDDDGPHNGHTGSNSSLNSESTATSSENRYRVPKSAIERSQSWRRPGFASSSIGARPLPAKPQKMRKIWAPGQTSILLGGGAPRG